METIYTILLIIGVIIIFIGIVRLIIEPPKDFTDFILQLFLIDWLSDIFCSIIESICDSD